MGHWGDAADQLIAWMDRTKTTLNELTPTGRASLREIEIQQCKLTVVRNDVHAHEPRLVLNLFTNKTKLFKHCCCNTQNFHVCTTIINLWGGLGIDRASYHFMHIDPGNVKLLHLFLHVLWTFRNSSESWYELSIFCACLCRFLHSLAGMLLLRIYDYQSFLESVKLWK